jgi:hypothetical protein
VAIYVYGISSAAAIPVFELPDPAAEGSGELDGRTRSTETIKTQDDSGIEERND